MRGKITLSISLVLSVVLLSLMSTDWTAKAAPPQRYVWDTGIVTLGPNQRLRIHDDMGGTTESIVRFRKMEYTQGTCNGDGVCRPTVASTTTSSPITQMPGEAASFDISNSAFGVRGTVFSNSRDVRVTAVIIDTVTGGVVAIMMDDDLLVR